MVMISSFQISLQVSQTEGLYVVEILLFTGKGTNCASLSVKILLLMMESASLMIVEAVACDDWIRPAVASTMLDVNATPARKPWILFPIVEVSSADS